jgi:hypothetical protein
MMDEGKIPCQRFGFAELIQQKVRPLLLILLSGIDSFSFYAYL